jgi:putative ABC transport system permease protein
VGGCVLAAVGIKTLVPLIPSNTVPSGAVIGLNGSVLLATLAIAFFSSLVFGLAPALHSARVELNPSLKGAKSGRGRLRNLLVVGEVALSLTLLVGAGLLIRTFFALRQVTLGFEPDHVLTMAIPLPDGRYAKAGQKARFFRDLMARVEALPGVVSAAETSSLPPYGGIPSALEIGGKARENGRDALFHLISERYFETLRVRLLRGRNFTAEEVSVGRKVAVISETFARENFGSENPLGRQLKFTFLEQMPNPVKDPWFQIVGVVADVKNQGLQQPARAAAYVPYTVTGFGGRGILVRAVGNPKALLSAVRHEITAIDSNLAPDSSGLAACCDAGPVDVLLALTTALHADSPQPVRRCRIDAGQYWYLRRGVLHGVEEDARDRDSHRARRTGRARDSDRSQFGDATCGVGNGGGIGA